MTTGKIRCMIRKAVGAIVKSNDKFLLIHKVKIMDAGEIKEKDVGKLSFFIWGIVHGTVSVVQTEFFGDH